MVVLLRSYRVIHAQGKPHCFNPVMIKNFKFPNDHDFGIDYTKSADEVREQWRQLLLMWRLPNGKPLPLNTIPTEQQNSVPVHYNVYMFGVSKGMSTIHNGKKSAYISLFPAYTDNGEKLTVAEHGYLVNRKKRI